MKISFIGAGKVATSLGLYFKENNLDLLGYYSRSYESALNSSSMTDSKALEKIEDALQADIIFITVNDDAIKYVANQIADLALDYKNKIFVHTSGAHSSNEINILRKPGSDIVSLHPIQAFADIEDSLAQLNKTFFSIEGDQNGINVIKNILDKCNNKYFILEEKQKSLYHASACVVSNYLVTLLDYGFSILEHIGIPEELAMDSFFPLIEANIKSVKKLGSQDALTGPISRGDVNTIKDHLQGFEDNNFLDTQLYRVLGNYTLSLAKTNKLKDDKLAKDISKLLEEI